MLKITAGEFRDNPQRYLDQVDAGEELMLQRGEGKQYLVIPADDVLADIPPEYILEPDEDLERAITLDELLEGVKADIHEMFKQKVCKL